MLSGNECAFDQAWTLYCDFGACEPETTVGLGCPKKGGADLWMVHWTRQVAGRGYEGIGSPICDMDGKWFGSIGLEATHELGTDMGFEVGTEVCTCIGRPADEPEDSSGFALGTAVVVRFHQRACTAEDPAG